MLLNVGIYFGRFHPLIVHLPIGFLLLADFFYVLSRRKKYEGLRLAVPASLLIGCLSAAFACLTGYLLSFNGNYDQEILAIHLRSGIVTTLIAMLAYLISIKKLPVRFFKSGSMLMVLMILLFILINFTGHLGGTLTHGGDYLSAAVLFNKQEAKKKITDINDVYVFKDLVKPILDEKCVSCHNDSKKNGELSLANFESILKGGKHGPGIQPGNLSGSEIIKRISMLPKSKKFMPANGRTPLTWQETEVLRWWIEKVVAGKDRKLAEVNPPAAMINYAAAYFGTVINDTSSQYATVNIKAPPIRKEAVAKLKESGFLIKYLNYKPDILDVTLLNQDSARNIGSLLKSLLEVKDNILWLNVAGNRVSDGEMQTIGQFVNVERLRLDRNPITDKGLQKLSSLSQLQSLNLNGTKVTKESLSLLSGNSSLQRVYVWNSGIKDEELAGLKLAFQVISASDMQVKSESPLSVPVSRKTRLAKEQQ